jgi:hypothetical protein
MKSRTLILATIALWVTLVFAVGYWKLSYAWRWGAAMVFFVVYVPILSVLLAVVLSLEIFLGRRKS